MSTPLLSPHEAESSTWKKIKAHLESELRDRRDWNDSKSLDATETAFVRGEIARLKKLLKMGYTKTPD